MTQQLICFLRRSTIGLSVLLPLSALGVVVTAQAMAADTLQVSVTSPTPEQGIPLSIEFSGDSSAIDNEGDGPSLVAIVRPVGGVGCQSNYADDHSAAGGVSGELFGPEVNGWGDEPEVGPGDYHETSTYNPPATGTYMVCAWLEGRAENGERVMAGPASSTFSVRGPQVSELAVTLPELALPGVAFQIDYTTHTDQQLGMSSVIRPAGGLPCASDATLDSEQNQSEAALLAGPYDDGSEDIFGGPITTSATVTEPAGPYVVCTWIEGPSANEVDASTSTDIYVGTPPSPPPGLPASRYVGAASPHLSFSGIRVSKHHGTVVRGRGAPALTGRMRVSVSCGVSSVSSVASIVRGSFRISLATPRRCRKGASARVTVRWPGSSGFLKQSVSDRVRVTN